MDKKCDLESQCYNLTAHSSTPLLLNHQLPKASSNAVPRLPAVLTPQSRSKLNIFALISVLVGLALLLVHPPLLASVAVLPGNLHSWLTNALPASYRHSSSKLTKVSNLPHHLIPKTYIHHTSTNRRLVVVGDVHGVHDELTQLLSHISFNASNDHLILAGDMINKGPASHGVISLARSLKASGVRGNHEDKILTIRDAYDADPSSFAHDDSRELKVAKELSKKDVEWLRQCPLILRLGPLPGIRQKETVVVHAGLLPLVELDEQKPFDVMHMRSISKRTGKGKGKHRRHKTQFRAFEDRHEGDDPWWKVWNSVQVRLEKDERTLVLYGHDSHTGLIEKQWSIGLDSGCVTGGRLSALVIEGEDEKTGELRMKVKSVKCKTYR